MRNIFDNLSIICVSYVIYDFIIGITASLTWFITIIGLTILYSLIDGFAYRKEGD